MGKNNQWIALFSQTGTELVQLSISLGVCPDVILTDNFNYKLHAHFIKNNVTILRMSATEINAWLLDGRNVEKHSLITAHGYLKILPPSVIAFLRDEKRTAVYNGHPGLITLFPELRGKDPQKKVYEGVISGRYSTVGSVIHVIDEGVDTGPIVMIMQRRLFNNDFTEEEIFKLQSELSFNAWRAFLTPHFTY